MHGASNREKKHTQIKINKFIYLKRERDEWAEETLVAGGRRLVFNFDVERERDLR
jgi:hypothetical protein